MTEWVDFVKSVQQRDNITYSKALRTASSEWKKKKSVKAEKSPQDAKLRKLDGTAKRRKDIKMTGHKKTQKNSKQHSSY